MFLNKNSEIPNEQLVFYIEKTKGHKFFNCPIEDLTNQEMQAMVGFLIEKYVKDNTKDKN